MSYTGYIILGLCIGGAFFSLAAWGLYWAVKTGQFQNLSKGAYVVFDEEEPAGKQTDFFPGKGPANEDPPRESSERK